jgi:hypothetical protein
MEKQKALELLLDVLFIRYLKKSFNKTKKPRTPARKKIYNKKLE